MSKRNTTGAIILLLVLLFPLVLYFVFNALTYPVYKSFPYEYKVTATGDSLPLVVPTFSLYTAEGTEITHDDILGNISFVAFVAHPDSQATRLLTGTLHRIHENLRDNAGNIRFFFFPDR